MNRSDRRARQCARRVNDLGLDDIIGNRVDRESGYERRATSTVMSAEIIAANRLLDNAGTTSTLQQHLGQADQRPLGSSWEFILVSDT